MGRYERGPAVIPRAARIEALLVGRRREVEVVGDEQIEVADPLRTGEGVWGARFTSSGEWVVTQSGIAWELPRASRPVPSWLAELAEGIGGQRLDHGNFTAPGRLAGAAQAAI